MNKTIKIGFLFPYSSIHPNMSKDVIDGFQCVIPEKFKKQFQFCPEYVHQGNADLVKIAINKLISFENVDVVSGIVNYKLIPEISDIMGNKNKLGFFFDLGEYLPPLELTPPNIFFNSFQMWQLQFALGNWAQKQYKGKGAILMSLYDAGYHLQSAFWQGAVVAGAEEIDMHTLPYDGEKYCVYDLIDRYLDKIADSDVDYLHPIFCGNEATAFFDCYKKSKLYNKLPLVVSPHMASDEILSQVKNLNVKCFSASGWDYSSKDEINSAFKSNYEGTTGKKASPYAVMGYEAGLGLFNSLGNWNDGDITSVVKSLSEQYIMSPRGMRGFSMDKQLLTSVINIEEIKPSSLVIEKKIIDQGAAMNYNHAVFEDIHTKNISGWKNPYLCI